jgi:hypothetical protein
VSVVDKQAKYRAGPAQRWVCAACGKTTAPGGDRRDFRDSACFSNAVLCEAEQRRRDDGELAWWPVES